MLGTFGGALEARNIDASGGRLTGTVRGEVETDEKVLVIKRIHVEYQVVAPETARETVERVHGMYAMRCPLYRTLARSHPAQLQLCAGTAGVHLSLAAPQHDAREGARLLSRAVSIRID